MHKENIGVIRGVFDPVHKGHISAMISSIETLTLSKLYVIIKFIGEKDPVTSIDERLEMMKIHLNGYDLPVEVHRQNIKGHTEELLELNNRHCGDVINICGSDKVIREMEVYGNGGDTFGMVCRPEFDKYKAAHEKSLEEGIQLININPLIATSSTNIRKGFAEGNIYQEGLDENVSGYIEQNGLYLPYNESKSKQEFILGWFHFLEKLIPLFPDLHLLDIEIPDFNPLQSKNAWKEKFIRTVVKSRKLKGDILVIFVTQAEKIEIAL